MTADTVEGHLASLERPHDNLLKYYLICSLIVGPFFPFLLIALYLRFRTLRFRFDHEGVSMRWGALFRKEISLTYTRIQDIHISSNAVERYFGLGRVLVQTASGAAKAEMTIEGLQEFELVRDYLYTRMRGARGEAEDTAPGSELIADQIGNLAPDELAATLSEVARELSAIRGLLATALDEGRLPPKS